MNRFVTWLWRISPLRIAMVIAVVFSATHFVIESEFFEYGLFSKKGFIHLLDLKALDLKFFGRGEITDATPQVVIAAIDEKGVEKYGLWPWSRKVIADFIRTATGGGVKVIGFDAVFSDEDRNASYMDVKRFLDAYRDAGLDPGSAATQKLNGQLLRLEKNQGEAKATMAALDRRLRSTKNGESRRLRESLTNLQRNTNTLQRQLNETRKLLEDRQTRSGVFFKKMEEVVEAGSPDAALRDAIANSPQTVMGYFNFYRRDEIVGVDADELMSSIARLGTAAITQVYDRDFREAGGSVVEILEPVGVDLSEMQIRPLVAARVPLERFSSVAQNFGFFNIIPDPDGPMRRIRLLNRHNEKLYPALSLATVEKYYDGEIRPLNGTIKPDVTLDGINLAPHVADIPTDLHGRLLINYYQDPARFFPTFSVADIVDGAIKPEEYRDKVMLFGMTAQGLFDLRPTPFAPDTPGVYIHAMAIQNMLDENYLERLYGIALVEMLGYLLLGFLMGVVLPRLPAWGGLLGFIGFAAGLYAIDIFFVFPNGTWMLNVLPTLQAAVTFLGINVYSFLTEGREKRKIRRAFQFYLTKSVVDEVLKDPNRLKLGGEKRTCTVLFSDIRGFTTISEKLTPEQLVNLLNDYLTPMTNIVFRYDGTLDKYMGDAIMAIFGAPVAHPDSATRACLASLEMLEELGRLQAGWRAQGLPELDVGIGLNTGPMSVGNMGSEVRFDYTVMGDNVNLGSRLEGINKQYGTNIIISQSTYEAAKGDIHVRELDSVRVKGKSEPVVIYELLGKSTTNAAADPLVEAFEQGITSYKAQRWDEAISFFKRVHDEIRPGDVASTVYLRRCEAMRENPPGPDWDGVFVMTTK